MKRNFSATFNTIHINYEVDEKDAWVVDGKRARKCDAPSRRPIIESHVHAHDDGSRMEIDESWS